MYSAPFPIMDYSTGPMVTTSEKNKKNSWCENKHAKQFRQEIQLFWVIHWRTFYYGLKHWHLVCMYIYTYMWYLLPVCTISNFQTHIKDRYLQHFLWNCPQVNATLYHRWLTNIGSSNGLLSSGNNPFTWANVGTDLCHHVISLDSNEFSGPHSSSTLCFSCVQR